MHQFPGTRSSQPATRQPRRSGQPWTTADYELLVRRCRAGDSAEDLADVLERTDHAVSQRAQRLLPLDQRGGPQDRAVPHLHRLLREDDAYDWEHHLAATPPPRPVVSYLPPPQVRHGVPGLTDDQLVAICLLAVQSAPDPFAEDLRHDLSRELEERDLHEQLMQSLSRASEVWLESFAREGFSWRYGAVWPDLPPQAYAESWMYDSEPTYDEPPPEPDPSPEEVPPPYDEW